MSADARPRHLGDFTVGPRVAVLTAWALPIGAAGSVAALALLRLIGLITNLVFRQRVDTALLAPGGAHHPAVLIVLAPVAGGLAVGLMARYGSEKIRGHGMPETIEAILTRSSLIQPRVAVLKPLSAAVSIGTGGPFGAEGPIIMTGGAIGSILAQSLKLSADERKTLLVAGAAAGMAATFNAPVASVLLAVELLLFEWRPRSFLPVVAAVAVSTVVRGPLLGTAPVFPVPAAHGSYSGGIEALCALSGVTGGLLAVAATFLVYRAEDGFARLPLHWMWWPAIGGLIIGVGGLVEPHALGVGYDVIDSLLTGRAGMSLIVGILVVKTLIWSLSLGSGTSGGVLAPVFMIGAALGALESHVLPGVFPGFWAMTGLAAVLGGVMRAPLTGVMFTLELTHVWSAALPLLIASSCAYGLSTVVLKRSVLTEKIARRGLHLTREYSTDPLETFFAKEVMDTDPVLLGRDEPVQGVLRRLDADPGDPAALPLAQRLYPVVGGNGELVGVVTRRTLLAAAADGEATLTVGAVMASDPVAVHVDDTLRQVVQAFAGNGITRAPVVDRAGPRRVRGVITLTQLLHARLHDLTEEHERARHLLLPASGRGAARRTGPSRPVPPSTKGAASVPRTATLEEA